MNNFVEFKTINLSKIERFRFDAEYYQNDFLNLMSDLSKVPTELLGNIAVIRSGTTPRDRDDELTEGVNLLKTNDIRNVPLLKNRNYYKITNETAKAMASTSVKPSDILINIVGATLDVVGRVAFVPEDFDETNITQAMALIRVQDPRFLPEYIFAFLLSSIGNNQARRLARPTGQYNLNLPEVSAIKVPLLDLESQKEIARRLSRAESSFKEADDILKKANDLLSVELGFDDFRWNDEKFSVRNSTNVFKDGRLDSEYWQVGFDEILTRISNYPHGHEKLNKKFESAKKTFKPRALTEYNYVEISDIDVKSGEITPNKVPSEELPVNAKIELRDTSLLVSKVRPNRGAIAIADGLNGTIVSGALVTLTPKADLNLETLMIYLRLEPIREFVLKFNTGTSYPTITDEVISDLPVPNIPKEIQIKVSELVAKCKELNHRAQVEILGMVDLVSINSL